MLRPITQILVDAYARFYERWWWLVAAFVIGMTTISIVGLRNLKLNDNVISLFVSRSETSTEFDPQIEGSDNICLVMLASEELFSREGLGAVRKIDERLESITGVVRVTCLYDMRRPRRVGRRRLFTSIIPPPDAELDRIVAAKTEALNHPMGAGHLLSKDGNATLLVTELAASISNTAEFAPIVAEIESAVAESLRDTGIQGHVAGIPSVRVQVAESMIRDQLVFNVAGPLVACFVAFCKFRRLAAVVIVTIGPVLGVVWTIGLLGLYGEPLNPVNGVIAPLALTIGLADSVHMLFHVRAQRSAGAAPMRAAGTAIRQVGFPCALTSLTSAIGFASLAIADLQVIQRFGICAAVAVIVSFVAVLTVVPLLSSSFLGDHIQLRSDSSKPQRDSVTEDRLKWHTRLVQFVVRYRRPAFVVSVVVTLAALWIGSQLRADIRFSNGLPSSGNLALAFREIDEKFEGSIPLLLSVRWSDESDPTPDELLAAVDAAHHSLDDRAIISPAISLATIYQILPERDRDPASLMKQLGKLSDQRLKLFIDDEARQALVMSRCQDAGSHPIEDMIAEVQRDLTDLESQHPGFRLRVTESLLTSMRIGNRVVLDLMKSLFMAVPITVIVLILALRSVRAGLVALIPNVFAMAALAATMVLVGQPLVVTGSAVFCMCFGIAVDNTIHSLAGFQRHDHSGLPAAEVIIATYREIGDAVVSTSLILIAGLGVVMLGQTPATRIFGAMFCMGMAWAVVGDLIILPAILACFPPKHQVDTGQSEESLAATSSE